MIRPRAILAWLPCWLLLLGAIHASSAGGPLAVHANGATRELVKSERAGPYELRVGILPGIPRVGNLHLSIQVRDAAQGTILTGGAVTVTATGPEGSTAVGPVAAVASLESPQFYDVDVPLDTIGRWNFTLQVEAELGNAALDVPLDVSEAEGFNLIFLLALAIAFLALAIWTWDRVRGRRRRRRSKA
ncbi:MAG: hypothetical protein J4F43_06740 [Dehalococcoidia bacterium]|nr:hypothetical protein [Dehalococcoidia bacterium]